MNLRRVLPLALVCALVCVPLFGQSVRGNLSGVVRDASGSVVPGASITIRNTATGEEFTAVTDSLGGYAFPSIALGTYTLVSEMTGFKKVEMSGIIVEVGKPALVDLALQVGGTSEQVVVTGESQKVVNTSSPTLTNVINTRQVIDLPLATRNPMDLARLQAGIAVTGTDTRTASVGGIRGSGTNVTQDGVNAMDNFVKTDSFFAISAPSLNSTEEFSVTVGTVGSDAGRGVAQVRMVTKSGTNQLHGNLFWQHRNDFLEANTFFNNAAGTKRPLERQNWFGVTSGGPLWLPKLYDGRNKSFWFFSYEGFREPFQVTRNRTVLTDAARKGSFSYTGADGALKTLDLLSIGNARSLNAVTSSMLSKMPLPNNSLVGDGFNTGGFQYNVTGSDPSDKFVGRFDQQLLQSQRWGFHKLEFVFNRATFLLAPDTFNSLEAPFPGAINAYQASSRTLMATAIHSTFGSRIVNEARFGHQRAPVGFLRDAPPSNPFFTSFQAATTYDNTFMSQGRNTLVYQFLDNFAVVRGTHTLRFGTDAQSISALTFNDAGIQPTVTLGTNAENPDGILNTAFPSLPAGATGTAVANRARNVFYDITGFLNNSAQTFNVASPTSGFVGGATRQRNFRQREIALYAQDQWRVRRSLTANYGIRWEWQGVPYETAGLAIQPVNGDAGLYGISGFGNLFAPGSLKGTSPTSLDFVNGKTGKKLYEDDWNNFAPFLGLAWGPHFKNGLLARIFGREGQSSIRAGYSISYLHDGFTTVSNALGTGTTNPGLIQAASNPNPKGTLTSAGVPVQTPVFKMPISDLENLGVNPANGLWTFESNLRVPYVQQWSFGIERELSNSMVFEVRYVGNHAVKVFRAYNVNEVNIFENGFLKEFQNAQDNLKLNNGASFSPTVAGGKPTPTLDILFAGLPTSSGYASSGFINNLNNNNIGAMANTIAFQPGYRTTRPNLSANFFVANPNAAFARVLANSSYSNYNSVQFEIRKRLSRGLAFQADYTFSKALGDSEGSQSTLEEFRTMRNQGLDRHRLNFDQTHRVIMNYIYDLPFGTGRRWLSGTFGPVRKAVEGWNVGSIVNWQTGPPITVYSNRSTFNSTQAGLNPAQLANGVSFTDFRKKFDVYRAPQGVFFVDPSVLNITTNATTGALTTATLKDGYLTAPAAGTLGNFPRNAFNAPSFTQVDFAVTKRTYLGERKSIDLKVTFLNAFNHPNFSIASPTFDSATFARINSTRGSARVIHFILSISY
jgi:hypothetical protein